MDHHGTATVQAAACGQLELAQITAHSNTGTPRFVVAGLPARDALHARDRVRAAVLNSGFGWPDRVQVTIKPRSIRSDTGLDVTIALAVLAATGQLTAAAVTDVVCIGELGLDGRIRTPCDVHMRFVVAARAGLGCAFIPAAAVKDAEVVPGMLVRPISDLRDLVSALEQRHLTEQETTGPDGTGR